MTQLHITLPQLHILFFKSNIFYEIVIETIINKLQHLVDEKKLVERLLLMRGYKKKISLGNNLRIIFTKKEFIYDIFTIYFLIYTNLLMRFPNICIDRC